MAHESMAEHPLKQMFDAAVDAVAGDRAVERALHSYSSEQVFLVAVGKAAAAMTHGAVNVLGERLIDGLVISKYDHIDQVLLDRYPLRCMESSHPVPDQNSLNAGRALQDYLRNLPASAELVFLTSGGTSSLVEALPAGMTLQDLMRVNQYLLSSGFDIVEMNRVRKSISEIKGGRLARALRHRHTLQLLVSDVPGDTIEDIGSGLLIPPTKRAGVESLELPQWLRDLQQLSCEPPAETDPVWDTIDSRIVASNQMACAAASRCAAQLGIPVHLNNGLLTGDVDQMADSIAAHVTTHADAGPGLYIWGGETTVQLPNNPGRGGRNQQLAVQLAANLTDLQDWQLLSCGTDGSDGPTNDAGGLLSDQSFRKAKESGLDPQLYLQAADTGTFLENSGTLVTTGPTGTNVMDIVLFLKQ